MQLWNKHGIDVMCVQELKTGEETPDSRLMEFLVTLMLCT